MRLAFCSDHRGYKLKVELIKEIINRFGYECSDFGTNNDTRCNLEDYAFSTCKRVADQEFDYGIVICGSGDGACIISNKVKGIRATLAINKSDVIRAKEHENINVLAMGSEKTSLDEAIKMVEALVKTEFLKGIYQDRIDIISNYEKEH